MSHENEAARKMTILQTTRTMRVDGVVKVVLRHMAQRDRERFRYYVCSMKNDDDLADEFRAHGIEPIFLDHRGPQDIPRSIGRLAQLIRRLRIDLVHANRTLDLALAGTAARLSGIPVVSTIHWLGRLEDHPEQAEQLSTLRRWLEMRATVRLNRVLAHRILTVSGAVSESYASMPGFPVHRTQVVSPGVDMRQIHALSVSDAEALRLRLGLESAAPVLLNIGRLDPVKGQRHLVPMMRQVRAQWPRARLLIAGEGELRQELTSAIATEGLQENITLLGQRHDVDALLALSDLLILSSESEAAPLPLFEAMRAGKPVVATAVGGVREIVQQGVTGLIVPRGDPNAMAEAVLSLLSKPAERERMGKAARRAGRERFDSALSVKTIEDVYCTLIDGKAFPPTQGRTPHRQFQC